MKLKTVENNVPAAAQSFADWLKYGEPVSKNVTSKVAKFVVRKLQMRRYCSDPSDSLGQLDHNGTHG